MYAYVNGIVVDVTEDNCILDVNDIGYNVRISPSTASRLPAVGEKTRLYTYTCVREDAFLLYGFLSKNELELFKQLITVNGIGPKGGLSILSVMDADSLRFAIMSQDAKSIAKAPGIGAKTAERIILDLKDKISIDDTLIQREVDSYKPASTAMNAHALETIEALVALGYAKTDATKAVNNVPNKDVLDSGALLKAALKYIFM